MLNFLLAATEKQLSSHRPDYQIRILYLAMHFSREQQKKIVGHIWPVADKGFGKVTAQSVREKTWKSNY